MAKKNNSWKTFFIFTNLIFLIKMKILHSFLCFIALTTIGFSQSKPKENLVLDNGVSEQLAIFRKHQISDVTYGLSFEIPQQKQQEINSNLILNLSIADLSEPLYLDFKVKTQNIKSIQVNSKSTGIVHEKGHIVVAAKDLILGKNTVVISFIAGDLSLNRNDDFLYTLLVPDRASTLSPCLDQPNIKATYKLSLTVPKDWTVLAGAKVKEKVEKGRFCKLYFWRI